MATIKKIILLALTALIYLRDVLYDDAFQIIGHIDLAELLIKAMEESV